MNKENLLKIKEYIEKCLIYKTKKLELENKHNRDEYIDITEVILFIHQALNPEMYEINKEVLNRELIKRQFERLPKR